MDLSAEASRAHRGGALDEIFTVYSIVNTLTDNLPAIVAVQLLVDGHQVDTLAGHVDVRRPLMKDLRWTELPPMRWIRHPRPTVAIAVSVAGSPAAQTQARSAG